MTISEIISDMSTFMDADVNNYLVDGNFIVRAAAVQETTLRTQSAMIFRENLKKLLDDGVIFSFPYTIGEMAAAALNLLGENNKLTENEEMLKKYFLSLRTNE